MAELQEQALREQALREQALKEKELEIEMEERKAKADALDAICRTIDAICAKPMPLRYVSAHDSAHIGAILSAYRRHVLELAERRRGVA